MNQKYFIFKDFVILLAFINGINSLHTLETPIPESLLKPRNYNPHPYQQYRSSSLALNSLDTYPLEYIGDNSILDVSPSIATPFVQQQQKQPANGIYSQGPVQFPPSPPARRLNNIRELPHPYPKLKIKGQLTRPNNRAQFTELVDDSLSSLVKKHYAFSYTVKDKLSGDDFSHSEQQNNGAVKGTYKVQLPDGRTQIVRYTADNDGYRADVSYIGEATTNEAVDIIGPTKTYLSTDSKSHTPIQYANIIPTNTRLTIDQQTVQHTPIYNLNPYNIESSGIKSSLGNLYSDENVVYNQANVYASPLANQQINAPLRPLPTSPSVPHSSIFVSTVKPPYELPLRKTIPYSAVGSGTYVVSPKLTQIQASSDYDYYPNYKYGNRESEVNVQLVTDSDRIRQQNIEQNENEQIQQVLY